MLTGIPISKGVWQRSRKIARYDVLGSEPLPCKRFSRLRLESWCEIKVILSFHLTGTTMEIFRVSAGAFQAWVIRL